MTDMTRRDREDLSRAARLRAKVARAQVDQRKAEMLADFEEQLATEYDFHDKRWAAAMAELRRAAEAANARVDQMLADVPKRYRPSAYGGWVNRGENYFAQRRAELRKAAVTRLDEMGKRAIAAIEQRTSEVLIELIAGGLESGEAREYLATIPTPEELIPTLTVAELEPERRRALMAAARDGDYHARNGSRSRPRSCHDHLRHRTPARRPRAGRLSQRIEYSLRVLVRVDVR
ncbi:MAG: hypothetical protein ACRDZ0_14540 [Acidimicrobiales bacterium]